MQLTIENDKLVAMAAVAGAALDDRLGYYRLSESALADFAAAVIAAHTAKVLGDVEPVAYMYPSDLAQFERKEMTAEAVSVSCTNIDTRERTVPLYPAHTVAALKSERDATNVQSEMLISSLASCRDAFPPPAHGEDAIAWSQAMGDPLFVPAYVKARAAALAARVAELEKDAEPEEFTLGIDAAAKMLDKMADDYSNEHAVQDPDTGVYEFGRGGKEDYYNTLRELADDIRSIVYAPGEWENTAQTLKAAKDAAFEQAANLLECEYAEDAKQKRRLDQIAQHIRDLKKRSS